MKINFLTIKLQHKLIDNQNTINQSIENKKKQNIKKIKFSIKKFQKQKH